MGVMIDAEDLGKMNIFLGDYGCLNYTDPTQHAPTSIVELPPSFVLANLPSATPQDKVRIMVKMMSESYANTIKSVVIRYWYEDVAPRISDKTIAVLGSSGGAALPFIMIGRLFGVQHFKVFIPKDANENKVRLIERAGGDAVEIIRTPEILDDTAAGLARALTGEPDHEVFDQYSSDLNVRAHMRVTIDQVWDQMLAAGVEMSGIAVGSGTCGTVNAAYEFLKEYHTGCIALAVLCNEGNPLPGMRAESRLTPKQVPLAEKNPFVRWKVDRYPSYQMCIQLLGVGLKVGLTTGGGVHGVFSFLENEHKHPAQWDKLRNKDDEIVFVVTNADLLELYLGQLGPILDADAMDVKKL
jgi:cysteine synthase